MSENQTEEFEPIVAGGVPISHLKDKMGRFRTNIFLEFNRQQWEEYPPIYTMKSTDRRGCVSARRIYLEAADEYDAAMQLVGSWEHWQKLCNNKNFMSGSDKGDKFDGLSAWREEKKIRDKSEARKLLRKSAEAGNVTAQKILYDGKEPAGRPSKAKVNQEATRIAEQERLLDEGWNKLKLIKNGS
jgi:hypothetical protein